MKENLEVDRNSDYIDHFFGAEVSTKKLQRALGFWDGMSVAVCIMIGTGIFASPGTALDHAGSPGASLVVWFLAGEFFPVLKLLFLTCVFRLYCVDCELMHN